MLWASYGRISQDGVKGILAEPNNRAEAVGTLLEAYGGKLVSYHMLMNGGIDFFIISEISDDKITDVAFVNALLVRGYGSIETITTVPAIRAEDALPHMRKAAEMASAMVYKPPAD
jgi:uncharacterized protein with GYD domain